MVTARPITDMNKNHVYCECGKPKRKESKTCIICFWDQIFNPDITDNERKRNRELKKMRRIREKLRAEGFTI